MNGSSCMLSAYRLYPRLFVYKRIRVYPKIRVYFHLELCPKNSELVDFPVFSTRHIDRRKCCPLSSTVASISQWAPTFVYNTLDVTHSVARFVRDSRDSLSFLLFNLFLCEVVRKTLTESSNARDSSSVSGMRKKTKTAGYKSGLIAWWLALLFRGLPLRLKSWLNSWLKSWLKSAWNKHGHFSVPMQYVDRLTIFVIEIVIDFWDPAMLVLKTSDWNDKNQP